MATVNDETQNADAKAAETRNEEYRAREWANLTDAEKAGRKAEAEALISERDDAMKRGMMRRVEEIDERLRRLNFPELQSTRREVQREHGRRLPEAELRAAVAAGQFRADILDEKNDDSGTTDSTSSTKGKGATK